MMDVSSWCSLADELSGSNHEAKAKAAVSRNIVHIGLYVDYASYYAVTFGKESGFDKSIRHAI